MKYEKIVEREEEAFNDGRTRDRKDREAFSGAKGSQDRECKATHFFRNSDHSDLCDDLWSGWLE